MISISDVIDAVATHYDVNRADLVGPRRMEPLAQRRQIAYFLAYRLCPEASLPKIAQAFGKRDHTTVMHGCKAVAKRLEANPDLEETIFSITARAKAAATKPAPSVRAQIVSAVTSPALRKRLAVSVPYE